jgi:hypothetical protein
VAHGPEPIVCTLRSGNVHSAEDWDKLLLPEIERQQAEGKCVALRAPPFRDDAPADLGAARADRLMGDQ